MSEDLFTVCLMNDSFPPQIDGVVNAVINYAEIIERDYGHAIVCTPEYPGYVDNCTYEVLRYPSINTEKLVGYRAGVPVDLDYIGRLYDKKIDIIHSHCPIASTVLGRLSRDAIRKPLVMTYHTKFDIDIKRAIDAKIIQDMAINAIVSNIESVDDVWCVSRGAGENLKSLGYKGDYIVMPNGVDFAKGKSKPEDIEAVKEEYGLPNDRPIFLFVGRMLWYKGIRITLDALKVLKSHNQPFKMLFVGDGMEIDEIKQYCQELDLTDECIFVGAVSDRNKLKAIFSACDLFLFPSTFDTNGIVVREAASSGLGSVLINGSCAAEDTIDKRNTLWIEENAESMAELLLSIGNNRDYMHEIGENAMNELYMSWDDAVALAIDRYKYVIDKWEFKKPSLMDDETTAFNALVYGLAETANSIDKARKSVERGTDKFFEWLDRWL